jgi:carbohydrate kinase (thermoresistant glucokinase family)
MAAGHPLADEDRWPWLQAIGAWIDGQLARGERGVVSCSALKRAYRDVLRRPGVQVVYLRGTRELLAQRMAARHGHFFRPAMLDSQLADLEEPSPDEDVVLVSIAGTPDDIVEAIVAATGVP